MAFGVTKALNVAVVTSVAGFINSMGAAAQALLDFRAVAAGASAVIGGLLIGNIQQSVEEFRRFQDELRKVQRQTGMVVGRQVLENIENLSKTIPVARGEMAKLAEEFGRAGVSGTENLTKMTERAAKFAEVTDISFGSAAQKIVKLIGLLGKSPGDIEEITNKINILGKSTVASSNTIVDSLRRSANAMRTIGFETNQILALNAALQRIGVSASTVGTAFRSISQQLLRPSRVQELAKNMNMTAEEFRNLLKENPADVIFRIAESLDEGTKRGRQFLEIFGKRAKKLLPKLSDSQERYNERLAELNRKQGKVDTVQKDFALSTDKINSKLKIASNRLDEAQRKLGEAFAPSVVSGTKALTNLFTAVTKTMDKFGSLKTTMVGFVSTLGIVIGSLTLTSSVLAGIPIAIGSILVAIAGFEKWANSTIEVTSKTKEMSESIRDTKSDVNSFTDSIEKLINKNQELSTEKKLGEFFRQAAIQIGSGSAKIEGAANNAINQLDETRKRLKEKIDVTDLFSGEGPLTPAQQQGFNKGDETRLVKERADAIINSINRIREASTLEGSKRNFKDLQSILSNLEGDFKKVQKDAVGVFLSRLRNGMEDSMRSVRKLVTENEELIKTFNDLPIEKQRELAKQLKFAQENYLEATNQATKFVKQAKRTEKSQKKMELLEKATNKTSSAYKKLRSDVLEFNGAVKRASKLVDQQTKRMIDMNAIIKESQVVTKDLIDEIESINESFKPINKTISETKSGLKSAMDRAKTKEQEDAVRSLGKRMENVVKFSRDFEAAVRNVSSISIGPNLKGELSGIDGPILKTADASDLLKNKLSSINKELKEIGKEKETPFDKFINQSESITKRLSKTNVKFRETKTRLSELFRKAREKGMDKQVKSLRNLSKELKNVAKNARKVTIEQGKDAGRTKMINGLLKISKKLDEVDNKFRGTFLDMEKLAKNVGKTLQRSFSDNFTKVIEGAQSFGDAMKNIFFDIVSVLQKQVTKSLVTQGLKMLPGAGQSGGIGGIISGFFGDTPGVMSLKENTALGFKEGDFVAASQTMEGLKKQVAQAGKNSIRRAATTGSPSSPEKKTEIFEINQDIDVAPGVRQIVRSEIARQGKKIAEQSKDAVEEGVRRGGDTSKNIRGDN